MANENNIIKPVEQTQNITGMSPIKRREKRKQKYILNKQTLRNKNTDAEENILPSTAARADEHTSSPIDYKA